MYYLRKCVNSILHIASPKMEAGGNANSIHKQVGQKQHSSESVVESFANAFWKMMASSGHK